MTARFPISAEEAELRRGADLLSVPGLRGAAVATGVKPSGSLDLALVTAAQPMNAAAVYTTCAMAAAPIEVSREVVEAHGQIRTVVVNSGNANALTGATGRAHAVRMQQAAEEACGGPVFVMSTGIIGRPLPIERVEGGIAQAAGALATDQGSAVADAFLTTDTTRKVAAVRAGPYTVSGVAKGSGMIHPDMATMLALIATDAPMSRDVLQSLLVDAVDESFHCITVDGDTSTNDTVLLLAGAGEPVSGDLADEVAAAVRRVARSLALQIVEDGEGATRLLDLVVVGAPTDARAREIARAVATSSLVKTALAGGDPNWGRLLAAAGNAGVPAEHAALWIGEVPVFREGDVLDAAEADLKAVFQAPRASVRLQVGRGEGRSHIVTTDLTHGYVTINAEYTT